MTARHILDATIQRFTGKDIRLSGNWEPLPDCGNRLAEVADALGTSERILRSCGDIADVLELIAPRRELLGALDQPAFF